jgi:hypothetical protein
MLTNCHGTLNLPTLPPPFPLSFMVSIPVAEYGDFGIFGSIAWSGAVSDTKGTTEDHY